MKKSLLLALLLATTIATVCLADVPSLIAYQGKLLNTDAIPVSGTHSLSFDIYTSPTGGTSLWTETHPSVALTQGLFNIELGNSTPIDTDTLLDAHSQLWIQVTLDASETFTRSRLVSAPYALLASNISGLDATSPQLNELVNGSMTILHSHAPTDAPTLDGLDSSQFLRSDINDSCNGAIIFTGETTGGGYADAAVQINPSNVDPMDILFSIYTSPSDMLWVSEPADLGLTGVIQAGTNSYGTSYNRLGNNTTTNPDITAADDLLINGDLEVKGNVYFGDKTHYISVSAVDFEEEDDNYQYIRGSNILYKDSGFAAAQNWRAVLHLPQGATITAFKIWFYDNHAQDLYVQLNRRSMDNVNANVLGLCSPTGTPGESTAENTSISNATVDNTAYVYYLALIFPAFDTASDLIFHAALITYTITEP